MLAAVAVEAVHEAQRDDAGRERLRIVCGRMRSGLREVGIEVANRDGPILPVVVGSEGAALGWSRRLLSHGVLVQAIRPPTVPQGTARLRITVRSSLMDADLGSVVEVFGSVVWELAGG